jgi:hypothetical protein
VVEGYTERVRALLLAHGCTYLRPGKGDHELWLCPGSTRPVVVDGRMMSRHTANGVLKQAGIKDRIR